MSQSSGVEMSVTEPGLRRSHMSWDDYLGLPDKPRAEWVDGEVVVSPTPNAVHGVVVTRLLSAVTAALPQLFVMTETGVWLPRNRLRGPDLMAVTSMPDGAWVTDPAVLVAEVLSRSTRSEDMVRKAPEYLAAGIGQYWIVDPDARSVDAYAAEAGEWVLRLHLGPADPVGEVDVDPHGAVPLDVGMLFP